MATQLSSLLLNEISVHYIHIYSYCYDRKSPRSHFVCGHFALTKQRNNCWLHFYFIFVFSNSKNVSYIFYYWFPHTRTHQNTHTFNLTYHSGKKVEKGVATAAVKLILTTAQTVILAFLVQMTSVSNQFCYTPCSMHFQPRRKHLPSKMELKIERLGTMCVCLCAMFESVFASVWITKRPHNSIYPIVLMQFNAESTT